MNGVARGDRDRRGPAALVPALEVGGTHVSAAVIGLDVGRFLPGTRRRLPLRAGDAVEAVMDTISRCASATAAAKDATWGVAIPGPFDCAHGIGRFRGVGKFECLDGVDVGRLLLESIRPTPWRLHFLNDADAFLLGGWSSGAAAGHDRAVAVTLGTGVGSAFLDRWAIIDAGPDVPPEGRADLLRIAGRPLEETVSRRAIMTRYAMLTDRTLAPGEDVRDIAERALDGEAAARAVFGGAFESLGRALSLWLARFRATILVVGGAVANSWDLVSEPLAIGIRAADHTLLDRVAVARGQLGDDAPLIGAARHAAASRQRSQDRGIRSRPASGSSTGVPDA